MENGQLIMESQSRKTIVFCSGYGLRASYFVCLKAAALANLISIIRDSYGSLDGGRLRDRPMEKGPFQPLNGKFFGFNVAATPGLLTTLARLGTNGGDRHPL